MTPPPYPAIVRGASIALSALLLTSCASVTPPAAPPAVESAAPGLQGTPPGAIDDGVAQANIQQTICVPGWTDTIRPSTSYTNALKAKHQRDQGLPASDATTYELDHFIPLALGGHPRKPENLWLQLWAGERGARTKDRLEVKLKTLVCKGQLSLQQPRDEIRMNWVAVCDGVIAWARQQPPLSLPDPSDEDSSAPPPA